jgi:hypothetical protein
MSIFSTKRALGVLAFVAAAACECAPAETPFAEPAACVDDAGCFESYCIDGACVQCVADNDCTAPGYVCIDGSCGPFRCVESIAFEPASCDCGDVEVGATGECTITLTNNGDREVSIVDGRFEDPSASSTFRLRNFVNPNSIAQGASLAFSVFCTPVDTTAAQTALILEFNVCPGEVSVPVSVRGTN